MPRKSTSKEKVDAYIARLSPPHKQFMESLRKIVVKASPKLEEKYKWRMPCYFRKGLVCYISAGKRHVTFGFYRGARLKDPKGQAGCGTKRGSKVTTIERLPWIVDRRSISE